VEYLASSGGLSCPDSDARMNYYNMSGIPDIVWDGIVRQVGSGSGDRDGISFAAKINARRAIDSPLAVSVMSYSFEGDSPSITVKVEIFTNLVSNADTYLRVGICENGLDYGGVPYHNVLRDMPPDTPLTIQNVGEIQEVTIPLAINHAWDPAELWAYAFVQRDVDREIYNAGSTMVTPYSMDVSVEGVQQVEIVAPYTFGETTITHLGTAAENIVDISLDISSLPVGWDAYFTMDSVDMTSTTVTLAQYEAANLTVTMVPGVDSGTGRAVLNVHSQSGEVPDFNVPFVGLVGGSDILIVSDDGGAGYAYDYFGPAIGTANKSFAVWERALAPISLATLAPYQAVIWQTGNKAAGMDADDRAAVQAYIGASGRLLLSGEHLVAEIMNEAGAWGQFNLRISYRSAEMGSSTVTGVVDDPITDGMVLDLLGGDGAGNYEDPDVVEPVNGGGGIQCFSYDADSGAGVRVEYGTTRILTLGFGFESINAVADRDLLMEKALSWLIPTTAVDSGSKLPSVAVLNQNAPNPFNPQTKISFVLDSQKNVQLNVYDLNGRLVRTLVDGIREAGENNVIWDGRNTAGDQVASGTYIYRLINADQIESRKMTLLK
jgi:hypothetical protein